MSAAVLDDHIRQIRNIQIGHQDLEPLLPNKRFYAGEVLDIYKKGASSRRGSVSDASTTSGLSFLALQEVSLVR